MTQITLRDFQPINNWVIDAAGPLFWDIDEPMFLIDQSTGRKYLNESKGVVRFKCFLLSLGTPFIHPLPLIRNIVSKMLNLISNAWKLVTDRETTFKAVLKQAGEDLLYIIFAPLSYLGIELAAIYGLVSPYDGRKLYASFERAQFGGHLLAPCFQPHPTHHAFGGDLNNRDVF